MICYGYDPVTTQGEDTAESEAMLGEDMLTYQNLNITGHTNITTNTNTNVHANTMTNTKTNTDMLTHKYKYFH